MLTFKCITFWIHQRINLFAKQPLLAFVPVVFAFSNASMPKIFFGPI